MTFFKSINMIKFTNLYPELQKEIVKKCTNCERFPLMFVNRRLNKISYIVSANYYIVNIYVQNGNLNLLKWIYLLNYKAECDYMAAYYGHLDILKWMYEKNGKVSQECARYAEYSNQKHIDKWLLSIQ